jgi:lathosterol oxidase
MVIVHDAYFYWTHRLLHWKPLFKVVHITHHLSRNPTPFSAYAFHPLEALINVGIVPLVAFTIPAHVSAIVIFTIYQLLINVLGHLGFELLPKWFAHNKVTKWHNTFTHHNLHHQFVKYNYGLYLNFWDRIMNTNHPHYEHHFDKVVERTEKSEIVLSGKVAHQEPDATTEHTLIADNNV